MKAMIKYQKIRYNFITTSDYICLVKLGKIVLKLPMVSTERMRYCNSQNLDFRQECNHK